MKKQGVDGKKRFSIKYLDGTIFRTGSCDPKEDERFGVVPCFVGRLSESTGLVEPRDTKYYLVQYQHHDTDYSQPEKSRELLPDGALIANGYYDHEWDEFVSPADWLKQSPAK